jgi:hypothetical protein
MLGQFYVKHVHGAVVLCPFALMPLASTYTPLLTLHPLIFSFNTLRLAALYYDNLYLFLYFSWECNL